MALGSFGDVHPFLGVSRELAARGHDVDFLANPFFEDAVRRAGLRFVSLGARETFEDALENPQMWTLRHGAKNLADALILPYMRPVYDWIAEHRRGNTVVIAPVTAFGARVARDKLGVPLATLLLQPALVRSRESIPGLPLIPARRRLQFLARPMRSAVMWGVDRLLFDPALARSVNAFRSELELPPRRRFFHEWVHSPELSIGLFPEWFGEPQSDWPTQVRCTGFPLFDEAGSRPIDAELERFLDAGSPPVVLTPGTAMKHGRRFFAAGIAACRRLGRRALLLTQFPDHAPSPLPPDVARFDYAPFSRVLPRAAAIVHHGGIGTSAQALRAGTPQLVHPFSFDQPDNAARLESLGVARTIFPLRFRAGRVARLLRELLESEGVREACAFHARRMLEDSGVDVTCRLIEELGARENRLHAVS